MDNKTNSTNFKTEKTTSSMMELLSSSRYFYLALVLSIIVINSLIQKMGFLSHNQNILYFIINRMVVIWYVVYIILIWLILAGDLVIKLRSLKALFVVLLLSSLYFFHRGYTLLRWIFINSLSANESISLYIILDMIRRYLYGILYIFLLFVVVNIISSLQLGKKLTGVVLITTIFLYCLAFFEFIYLLVIILPMTSPYSIFCWVLKIFTLIFIAIFLSKTENTIRYINKINAYE